MNPIRAVLFDYGMVLSGAARPRSLGAHAQPSPASAKKPSIASTGPTATPTTAATSPPKLTGTKSPPAQAIVLTPTQLTDLIAADVDFWITLNPPMLEWAQRLQRAGIRTGILSNMPDAMEAGLRARHHWLDAFDHHTWSHALKLAKPEPAIYLHAAKGLHTPPANILFIDDRQENIAAALAVGMQAIQYTTTPPSSDEMHERGLDSSRYN